MSAEILQRQRYLWRRRGRLECSCTDPCRCDIHDHPTPQRVDGYRDALNHLDRHGLSGAPLVPELRQLWRRGGTDRQMAESVQRRWVA